MMQKITKIKAPSRSARAAALVLAGTHSKAEAARAVGIKTASARAAALVLAGTHSKAEAARAVGITTSTVSKYLTSRGIKGVTARGRIAQLDGQRRERARYRRERGYPEPEIVGRAVYEDGLSFGRAAKKFGIPCGVVAGYCDRYRRAAAQAASKPQSGGRKDANR